VLRELEAMMIAEGEMPRGLLVTREAHNVPMEVAEIEAAIAELLSDVQKLPAPRFGSAS
jgi:hypothetical protein